MVYRIDPVTGMAKPVGSQQPVAGLQQPTNPFIQQQPGAAVAGKTYGQVAAEVRKTLPSTPLYTGGGSSGGNITSQPTTPVIYVETQAEYDKLIKEQASAKAEFEALKSREIERTAREQVARKSFQEAKTKGELLKAVTQSTQSQPEVKIPTYSTIVPTRTSYSGQETAIIQGRVSGTPRETIREAISTVEGLEISETKIEYPEYIIQEQRLPKPNEVSQFVEGVKESLTPSRESPFAQISELSTKGQKAFQESRKSKIRPVSENVMAELAFFGSIPERLTTDPGRTLGGLVGGALIPFPTIKTGKISTITAERGLIVPVEDAGKGIRGVSSQLLIESRGKLFTGRAKTLIKEVGKKSYAIGEVTIRKVPSESKAIINEITRQVPKERAFVVGSQAVSLPPKLGIERAVGVSKIAVRRGDKIITTEIGAKIISKEIKGRQLAIAITKEAKTGKLGIGVSIIKLKQQYVPTSFRRTNLITPEGQKMMYKDSTRFKPSKSPAAQILTTSSMGQVLGPKGIDFTLPTPKSFSITKQEKLIKQPTSLKISKGFKQIQSPITRTFRVEKQMQKSMEKTETLRKSTQTSKSISGGVSKQITNTTSRQKSLEKQLMKITSQQKLKQFPKNQVSFKPFTLSQRQFQGFIPLPKIKSTGKGTEQNKNILYKEFFKPIGSEKYLLTGKTLRSSGGKTSKNRYKTKKLEWW